MPGGHVRIGLWAAVLAASVTAPAHGTSAEWHRGMCFAHVVHPTRGYGSEASGQSLQRLQSLHVNWISLTPFGFAPNDTTPDVRMIHQAGAGYLQIGETDERVIAAAQQAHALGMKVMLKPHIWITPRGGSWRGSIHFADSADWDRWFAAYERFALHYARMAQTHGMEAFCIGTELATATRARPAKWRDLVRKVRAVYSGALTYAAHYDGEVEAITFWDAVDYIGVNAYYPLHPAADPTVDELAEAWKPFVQEMEELAGRWQRPVIFTEIGYRSTADAAHRPNLWSTDAPPSPMAQARAYEAVFKVFDDKPWFRGVYWWKWESDDAGFGGLDDPGFTPQHKPAEFILRTYYGRHAGRASPAGAASD